MKIKILINYLTLVFICCTSGCFGHSGAPYPNSWPKRSYGHNCPNVTGWYELETSSHAHEIIKFFADFELTGVSKGLRDSEQTKFVNEEYKNYYLSQLKLDDALPKLIRFKLDQIGCSNIFLSFVDSQGKFVKNTANLRSLECIPMKIADYDHEFFSSPSKRASSGGGSSFALGSFGSRMRIGTDIEGNLVRNDSSSSCGLALIPPVPICYSTSNTWRKYKRSTMQNENPQTDCHISH